MLVGGAGLIEGSMKEIPFSEFTEFMSFRTGHEISWDKGLPREF